MTANQAETHRSARPRQRFDWGGLLNKHALTMILVVLVAFFAIRLPGTFLTGTNVSSTLATQSVAAFLALAVLVPMVAGHFDLSVGYMLGLTCMTTIGFQAKQGMDWGAAVALSLLLGVLVGVLNGMLVVVAKINSFIATLGTGSLAYAIGLWYSEGQSIIGTFPDAFAAIGSVKNNVPLPAIYVVIAAVVIWLILEFTPLGRRLYVVGDSPRTATLLRVPTGAMTVGSFATAGLLTAIAGVILASQLQTAQSSTGPEYLLPAFAAVFLGSTAVRPGRANTWGTIIAVLVLATLITGLQQIGLAAWVQPLVNGVMLIGAVGAAGVVQRRRSQRAKAKESSNRLSQQAGSVSHERDKAGV
ncbi:ABC transporter permease [Pseudarthrobacter sp. AG30]|uniref:ABC transporter permease n=1 Tax=Pseudarthrobacter sp. AG30 TaxID=2249742 RepID=UPI000D6E5E36|nr:ABC transporter permease [Pseudarthrobacter sp. AG30]RAX15124.1 ABC transporter permease [Pseudarthrobacter sp. AG30]